MRGQYRRGVRALLKGKYTAEEKTLICDGVIETYAAARRFDFDGQRMARLYDAFCAKDVHAARRITALALKVGYVDYPRRGMGLGGELSSTGRATRVWLRRMISEQNFSAAEWIDLTTSGWESRTVPLETAGDSFSGWETVVDNTPGAVLALADAVDGDFTRIGWTEADQLNVARKLLNHRLSVGRVARWLELTEAQIESLNEDFYVLQWLENEHRLRRIDLTTPTRLAREINARSPRAPTSMVGIDGIVRDILLDPEVPYDVAVQIHDVLRDNWSKVATGKYSTFHLLTPNGRDLNPEQLARAERYFGRAQMRPDLVWTEARAEAKSIENTLRTASFSNVTEFMSIFSFRRFYTTPEGREPTDEETARLRATAEVYFGVLRERLPEFFALHPRAIDVRWVLETPLQVPWSLHNDGLWRRELRPFYQRWFTPKGKIVGPGEYLTSRHVFKMLDEALKTFVPRITSIADWNEVMTFRIRGAFEYEEFQRWAVNHYAAVAARLGDERLDWTLAAPSENEQAWKMRHSVEDLKPFALLATLRDLVPEAERSDQTLTAKAVELLLGRELDDLAGDRLNAQVNHPLRRALLNLIDQSSANREVISAETRRAWVKTMRISLFEYLAARSAAGAILPVPEDLRDSFLNLANALGFEVDQVTDGDHRGLKVVKTERADEG